MNADDQIAGRYRLTAPLGRGGMAEVWRARDERLERDVAIKLLAPQLLQDPAFLVRFFSEAQGVAKLSHPNVVSILDFGEMEGRPYLVMECVEGGAVADIEQLPLLPERALEIVAEAARGAGAAHKAGLVHRDIKPGNILLTDRGTATLADFGIAEWAASERLTATGTAIGSPHYVSPEQASGRETGPQSDVYSLGVVLYELLAGRPPFVENSATAIAIAHVESEPPPPSTFNPELDPALDALALTCLAKDPSHRFADGNELAEAIESGAYGAPVHIADDEPERPAWRTVLVGVAAAVILIAGAWFVSAATDGPELSSPAVAEDARDDRKVRRPKPSPSAAEDVDAVVATQPSPSPSPSPTPDKKDRVGDLAANDGYDVSAEPSPMEPEPEPSPTPEPEPEPSPVDGPSTDEEMAAPASDDPGEAAQEDLSP